MAENARLGALEVGAIYAESRGCYGSPRGVHAELRGRGQRTGRVARLMRAASLRARARRRFRRTTDSSHGMAIKRNLLARRFAMLTPNVGLVTDITYLWTLECWLYLAVILALLSRRVVGRALSERLERTVALRKLCAAFDAAAVFDNEKITKRKGSRALTPCVDQWNNAFEAALPSPRFEKQLPRGEEDETPVLLSSICVCRSYARSSGSRAEQRK